MCEGDSSGPRDVPRQRSSDGPREFVDKEQGRSLGFGRLRFGRSATIRNKMHLKPLMTGGAEIRGTQGRGSK